MDPVCYSMSQNPVIPFRKAPKAFRQLMVKFKGVEDEALFQGNHDPDLKRDKFNQYLAYLNQRDSRYGDQELRKRLQKYYFEEIKPSEGVFARLARPFHWAAFKIEKLFHHPSHIQYTRPFHSLAEFKIQADKIIGELKLQRASKELSQRCQESLLLPSLYEKELAEGIQRALTGVTKSIAYDHPKLLADAQERLHIERTDSGQVMMSWEKQTPVHLLDFKLIAQEAASQEGCLPQNTSTVFARELVEELLAGRNVLPGYKLSDITPGQKVVLEPESF